ncbi:DUF1127 domain-containing protein [Palleronia sp. LCG004]|uniref:DUF1127 domain-containing protein n=1 Tax=Palleronia sp. LCG004 TaxID=3079304 RepID=UPI002942991F|nr:DUF1127 domain-containing protein [Palleronia sp. LCG004]WOI55830.1 DUF1127 domain-containing protein [Palleronia sp. LCG004]
MSIYEVKNLPGEAISTRVVHAFTRVVERAIEAYEARATRNALRELSDEMLDDIGLNRWDIEAVARRSR